MSAVKDTKLYDTLSVDPSCSPNELRMAYKKAALKYHPDKNNAPGIREEAEDKFKNISHAYEILSDQDKRRIYDQYGEEGLEGGGGGGMNAEDIFQQFFGGGFASMFGGGMNTGPKKLQTINHVLKVSLEDIYRGKTSKLAVHRNIVCSGCDGQGGKNVKKCSECKGAGYIARMIQTGPMIRPFQSTCSACNGEGELMRSTDRCKKCSGRKTVVERKILHVPIDRGVKSGKNVHFPGEGDQAPGLITGDVDIVIEQKPHPRFSRTKDDLHYTANIDLLTALAGGKLYIEHLDDRWLELTITPGEPVTPGAIKQVTGEGMPGQRHHSHGDLYIAFKVIFPESDQIRNLDLLEKVLPPRIQPNLPPQSAHVEEVDLVQPADESRANRNEQMDIDEEDEDGHPGAERVQCASQ